MAKKGQSPYRDNPPHQERYLSQGGLITNACPEMPNGMEFDKPEVEQDFTMRQHQHWNEEDGVFGMPTGQEMTDYNLMHRVEEARFLHRPVTGTGTKPAPDDED